MEKSNKLFVKVKCKAYLKKANDGVHIEFFDHNGMFYSNKIVRDTEGAAIAYKNGKQFKDLSDFCGESVTKIYRERIEEEFTGIVVGYTKINMEGIIGTDWEYDSYCGEYGHCFKKITKRPKVAVVYYQNNCKRYVPVEDLEIL